MAGVWRGPCLDIVRRCVYYCPTREAAYFKSTFLARSLPKPRPLTLPSTTTMQSLTRTMIRKPRPFCLHLTLSQRRRYVLCRNASSPGGGAGELVGKVIPRSGLTSAPPSQSCLVSFLQSPDHLEP
ncbi:hypothetical protein E2C01_071295 [Portunus trituberculatus]|uniref:Uncharacterized protein n=1 Tax=Portunus trituberculatus TaxID=210409 RepID=A0A5B7HV00_PORTR|nr:hypothetical protein [Portunus trituberculatus]